MMQKKKWGAAKPVLIFNRRKILALIAYSVTESAKISGLKPGNISNVCNGHLMSNGMYYFRYIHENVEIDLSDIGTLKLEEYDKLCGVERPVYATTKMNRKNWKYKKKQENGNQSLQQVKA